MKTIAIVVSLVVSLHFAGECQATAPQTVSQIPAVRPLGTKISAASIPFGRVTSMVRLANGTVVVNDATKHRIVMLDSALSNPHVVLDDSGASARSYGRCGKALLALRGDTTLIVDPGTLALLVVDPNGKITAVRAVPQGPSTIAGIMLGHGAAIVGDRLVYAGSWGSVNPNGCVSRPVHNATADQTRDTVPILSADFRSNALDTLGAFTIPRQQQPVRSRDSTGCTITTVLFDPLPLDDDWAVTSDGWLAVIRGRDYSIEWIAPNGKRTGPSKVAHAWDPLSDGAKTALVDTVQRLSDAHPLGQSCRNSAGVDVPSQRPAQSLTEPQLPDYVPPFIQGAMADADGHLWIRVFPPNGITAVLPAGWTSDPAVYEVVDRNSRIVDRVQLPGGTMLVGFGPGVAYLSSRVGTTDELARFRIR